MSHHENKTAVRPKFLNFLDKFSLSTRTDEQVLQCVNFFLDKCNCSKASMCKFFFTHQQIKFAKSELCNENLLVCSRFNWVSERFREVIRQST